MLKSAGEMPDMKYLCACSTEHTSEALTVSLSDRCWMPSKLQADSARGTAKRVVGRLQMVCPLPGALGGTGGAVHAALWHRPAEI